MYNVDLVLFVVIFSVPLLCSFARINFAVLFAIRPYYRYLWYERVSIVLFWHPTCLHTYYRHAYSIHVACGNGLLRCFSHHHHSRIFNEILNK